jgi:hypothetical protein
MSNGGIFQLITNDGKQDRLLMASDLLRNRLEAAAASRAANPAISDPTPTLLDIEKTHVLFTNAHFKPFAAIGFEYNKTNTSAGNAALGSDVTFSIPQFGDFFHDMVLYVKIKQPTLTATAVSDSNKPLMRWCPFPGERLCESVEFEVNGNPLDKYYDYSVNFHREFHVAPNKRTAWDRCMGQEEPDVGFVDQPNWANSGLAPSAVTSRVRLTTFSGDQTPSGQKDTAVYKELLVPLNFWCNKDVRLAVPSVAIPFGQRFIKVSLCAPEKLVNLVPRGTGTWDDAGIGGYLTYDNMLKSIELYINNIFVNPEVHNIFIKRIGFSLIRVHRQQTLSASNSAVEVLLQQLKWPIETMYVGMRPSAYNSNDVVLRRQNLDKWHVFTQVNNTARSLQGWRSGRLSLKNATFALPASFFNTVGGTATHNLRLTSDAAWSIGANVFNGINAGDVLVISLTASNTGDLAGATTTQSVSQAVTLTLEVAQVNPDSDVSTRGYIVFKQLVSEVRALAGFTGLVTNEVGVGPVAGGITVATTAQVWRSDSAELSGSVPVAVPTLDTVTIKAHGIPIYNEFVDNFYNAYLPYHYGGPNITAPNDKGALFIPFNLYPGSYQPSGHLNISRAREFYLSYSSSVINNSNVGTLIVSATAINFLLISDGSAVLRYTT